MMRKVFVFLCAMVLLFGVVGTANSALTTIGTASYMGSDYNLIYEDNSIDGGLVWLDYTRGVDNWQNQVAWASGIGSSLTVNIDPGYTTDIDWSTGWRLPLAQDMTSGYNETGTEMGHLYYDSLEKHAGDSLGDDGPFFNVLTGDYWSGTEVYPSNFSAAWYFDEYGGQIGAVTNNDFYALAVHPGTVSGGSIPTVPIPSAIWLLGSGLIGLVGFRRKLRKEGK